MNRFDVVGSGVSIVGDEDDVGELMLHPSAKTAPMPPIRISAAALRNASTQGVSVPQEEMDFLPFEVTQIVFGGPTNSTAEAFPQRPFRGERLIASAFLNGVDVGGLVTISPALYVGAVQVGASQGQTPLSAFSAQAFGVRLSFPAAGQGTRVFIPFQYNGAALIVTDVLFVTFTVVGRAVR
jgi:hypothetical protein